MTLTDENLKILAALGKNPTGTNQSLCKDVGISSQSLKNRLDQLYSQKILLGVSATVSPFAVGLEAIAVFAEVSPENWSLFEKICDDHPYTRYRIRTFGAVNGIFAIFSVPFHTTHILIDLLEKLKKRGSIQNYELAVPTSSYLSSETDFGYYDVNIGWNFNWDKWEKTLEADEANGLESPPPSVLQRLDEKDMGILRQLSINSRRKNKDIAKILGIEPYHLSRRKKAMERMKVINYYRVLVGNQSLQITSHALLNCKASNDVIGSVATAVKQLPFQSTLIPVLDGFILYTTTTSLDFPILVTALRKQCSSMEFMWCDYRSGYRYWFYDEPFQNRQWKAEYDFMVRDVLCPLKNGDSDDIEN
ncbi:hypothetical protein HN588_01530 [Candidatus Bathyarchaeota archaeon]|nr:hypothetical protein [Candidatus Bathyarchaeota archaeon]